MKKVDEFTKMLVEQAILYAMSDELGNPTQLEIREACVYFHEPQAIVIDVLVSPEQVSVLEFRTRSMRQEWNGKLYRMTASIYRLRLETLPPNPFQELVRFIELIKGK